MSEETLSTRPANPGEKALREKFAESVAGQSELMDKLARQVITIQLAVPGLYATVLTLTQGEGATVTADVWFYVTFLCWSLSLALALMALMPRTWRVDPTKLKGDPAGRFAEMGLEAFFHESATYKRRRLIASIILFWIGILSAAVVLI